MELALESSWLIPHRVFRIALPTLALRRFAEDRQRPAKLDRQTPNAERHKEPGDHGRQTADAESVESDVCAGAEHRRRDVNLMTEEDRRDVAQRVANDSSDGPGDGAH